MKTILIATKRDGGEVTLAGSNVHYSKQREIRDSFGGGTHPEYSSVEIFSLVSIGKRLPLTVPPAPAPAVPPVDVPPAPAPAVPPVDVPPAPAPAPVAVKQSPAMPAKPTNKTK